MSQIRDWLEGLGLGEYAGAFEANDIELDLVPDLTEQTLKDIGVRSAGHRIRILKAAAAPAPGSAKYAPAALAEKIRDARAAIEGERKQVTILFADVKGSLDLIQGLDPEDARALLDPLLAIMMDAVHTFEGTVNDVQGDGIMAIFGAPIAHEDHALRACRAALKMQEEVAARARAGAFGGLDKPPRLRVGLHSGEVVVRAINNDLTMSYSAVGATTHVAARMEQLAEPGAIQLTGEVLRLVRGLVDVAAKGAVAVKGLDAPVEVFALEGLAQARTRLEAAGTEGLTPFVGRARELGYLEERLAEAMGGQGQVVLVVGDAGIGKSRLLLEFRQRLGNSAAWVEGRAISFGRSMAYHPLIDLLRRNFRIDEDDAPEAIRTKVDSGLARVAAELAPSAPLIHYLLGAAAAGDPVHAMDPQLRRAETFDALRRLMLLAAERTPQVIVFEDLHWSDTGTTEYLSHIIDSVPASRVLLLATLRTGHTPPIGERSYMTRLAMHNLAAEDSTRIVEGVLVAADLPDELKALVHRKAEGNPFFVEELVKSLRETGAIRREGARWVLGRPLDQIVVPDTVQGVLASRMDRLEDEARRTLQLASVIGREFTQRLLDRIGDLRASTNASLRELQAIELIYQKALYPELAYMFKHALAQDVAYGSLLVQRRRDLHRRVADAIEELYADRIGEHYAVIAHHLAAAEDWPRAAEYFDNAADHAAAAFAIHEAIALSEQAVDALERSGEPSATVRAGALHGKIAHLCMLLSDFARAHAEHARAAEIARAAGETAAEGWAAAGMALASLWAHEFDRGTAESRQAAALGRAAGSDDIVAAGMFCEAWVDLLTGRLGEARPKLDECERLVSPAALFYTSLGATALTFLAGWRGDYDAAVAKGTANVALAHRHNLGFPTIFALFALGLSLGGKGDYDQALATFEEGLGLAEKLGDEVFRNRLLNGLGWVHAECGGIERALELNRNAREFSTMRGDPETIANAELNLGDAFLAQGERALAGEMFERVHRLAGNPATSEWMRWRYSQHLFAGYGETCLARDDPAGAEDWANRCLELATRTDSKKYLVRGWRLKGAIDIACLRWEGAEEALLRSLEIAERIGNPPQLWKTRLALSRLYRDTARPDRARAAGAAARKVLDAIGAGLVTPSLRNAFERSFVIRDAYELSEVG